MFAILIVGLLLVVALLYGDVLSEPMMPFLRAEVVYTIMIVAILIILLMFILIGVQAGRKVIVRPKNDPNQIDEREEKTGGIQVAKEVVKEPTVIKIETEAPKRKDDKSEQTDESRFFMLTQLDEKYKD